MVQARQTVRQAVERAVRLDPTLSQRNILKQIRAEGHRIENTRGRLLVNLARQSLNREREQFNAGLLGAAQDFIEGLIPRETQLPTGRPRPVIDRFLRQIIREQESFELRGQRGLDRLSDFTQVLVEFRASADIDVYVNGQRIHSTTVDNINGRFTIGIRQFTMEFLAVKVKQQLAGRELLDNAPDLATVDGSPIEGVSVDVSNLRVTFNRIEGRGSARNA